MEPVRPALHEVAGSDGAAEQGARVQPQASDGVEAHLVIVVLVEALHERFVDGVQGQRGGRSPGPVLAEAGHLSRDSRRSFLIAMTWERPVEGCLGAAERIGVA